MHGTDRTYRHTKQQFNIDWASIFCMKKKTEKKIYHTQQVINQLESWPQHTGLTYSSTKTRYILFYKRTVAVTTELTY